MFNNVLHHVETGPNVRLRHQVHDHGDNELSNSINGQLRVGDTHVIQVVEVGHVKEHDCPLNGNSKQECELQLHNNLKRILDLTPRLLVQALESNSIHSWADVALLVGVLDLVGELIIIHTLNLIKVVHNVLVEGAQCGVVCFVAALFLGPGVEELPCSSIGQAEIP